jgi:hypothetical protein
MNRRTVVVQTRPWAPEPARNPHPPSFRGLGQSSTVLAALTAMGATYIASPPACSQWSQGTVGTSVTAGTSAFNFGSVSIPNAALIPLVQAYIASGGNATYHFSYQGNSFKIHGTAASPILEMCTGAVGSANLPQPGQLAPGAAASTTTSTNWLLYGVLGVVVVGGALYFASE